MTAAKQHAEWLSLVEVSGPFLTLTVLNQFFRFGLDAHDPDLYRAVKEAHTEWEETPSPAIHTAWVRFLIANVLGYPEEVIGEAQAIPESAVANLELQGERIRPDLAIFDPDDPRKVKLPIIVYPRSQKLDSPVAGTGWSASPHARMQALLQNTGIQVGFVTNGAQWSLVHVRKGEPTGFATWQTALLTEEKLLLQAFRGVLGVERTIGSPAGETLLDLLDKSAEDQEEVTQELGRQVREAVEVFLNALDRLDQDSGRRLLEGLEPVDVYNGALKLMMRLIFLLCAEERGLMDLRDLYTQHYSISSLNDQLRAAATLTGEEVLEHRHDAWMRLLATFRLVHSGCNHEDLNLIAYGGSLFDPARYAFLEKSRIDNRVTLHLLDALQFLEIRVPGAGRERRRLSFRALGVEQIGHVYEGLLDHTAVRATEPVVGLTGKETEEDEISLSLLEAHSEDIGSFFDKEKIKVSGNPNRLLLQQPDMLRVSKLRVACGSDEALFRRVSPFLNIIREDSIGHMQVYPAGSLYMTAGADRRSSGTHYTPVSLTEEVVQYALEPLVYIGPAEGKPQSEWKLRSAKELVDLKICDIAMGSGAFLVQACRYLSDRLVEAWGTALAKAQRPLGFNPAVGYFASATERERLAKKPPTLIETPFGRVTVGSPGAELISDNPEERLTQARRIVADRCLYGVDKNPMAAEIAKLSLWLITMHRDRPLTFLDHALKCGDSLVGVSLEELESFSLNVGADRGDLFLPWVHSAGNEVTNLRRLIRQTPSGTTLQVMQRAAWHQAAEAVEEALRAAANLLLTEAFTDIDADRRQAMFNQLQTRPSQEHAHELQAQLGRETFHFPLEFPDVFAEGGFHALIGNPPFVGGQRITGAMGVPYRDYLVRRVAHGQRGSADLCAYFFLRAARLLRDDGILGYLATNSISQGDTREVGLDQLLTARDGTGIRDGIPACMVYRAVKSVKWPSHSANLEVAKIWMGRGSWRGECVLDGQKVARITAFLDDGTVSGKPYRLVENENKSFIGSYVLGMGFVLAPEQAQALIAKEPKNADVVFPYLNGEDLNSRPDQSPSRWVINFKEWPLGRIGQLLPVSGETLLHVAETMEISLSDDWRPKAGSRWETAETERREKWTRIGVVPADYPGPVAADYMDCLAIVEELVKPERDKLNRAIRRRCWWRFAELSKGLYIAITGLPHVLVNSRVSKFFGWFLAPAGWIYNERLTVVASSATAQFALQQSSFHEAWMLVYGSTLETRPMYTPSDCFETFPFPESQDTSQLAGVGHEYHSHRERVCLGRSIGLTNAYNLVHDPGCVAADIAELRRLHVSMDTEVAAAYRWRDIPLRHDFYGEGKDRRFTLHPDARSAVLRRLLRLNHERYAEEVAAGLHEKGELRPKGADAPWLAGEPDALNVPRRNLFDDQLTLGEAE